MPDHYVACVHDPIAICPDFVQDHSLALVLIFLLIEIPCLSLGSPDERKGGCFSFCCSDVTGLEFICHMLFSSNDV